MRQMVWCSRLWIIIQQIFPSTGTHWCYRSWDILEIFYTPRFDPKTSRVFATFDNMDISWVQLNVLQIDNPKVIAESATKWDFLKHPDFQSFVREYLQSSQISLVLRAMVAKRGDHAPKFKFGIQVPNTHRIDEIWSGVSPSLYCVSYCVPIIGQCTA